MTMRERLFTRDGLIVLGTIAVLTSLVMVPHRLPESPVTSRVDRVVRVARGDGLSADLFTNDEVAGYYEGLLDAPEHDAGFPVMADLLRDDAVSRPADWPRIHESGAVERAHEFRRFTLRPDIDIMYHEVPLRTNRWGHRDGDVALEASPGTRRIAMCGASIAMGSGVPHEAVFGERLEVALNEAHTGDGVDRYEVVNFSVSGYRLTQLMDVVVDDVPAFAPDVVFIVLSDIGVDPRWWLHLVTLVSNGADLEYEWLRELVDEAGVRSNQRRSLMAERLVPFRERVMQTSVRQMIEASRSHGAEVIALAVPLPGYSDRLGDRIEPLRSVLADEAVPVIDLRDAFGDTDADTLWVRPWDRHPNVEGHRMLFERLYEKILGDPAVARAVLGSTASAP